MSKQIDVESLKEAINIVDVVSKYTDLRKTGAHSYTGLCPNPAHDDNNDGNFFVKEDEGYYKCFVCGDFKGDVITFIEEMENIDFMEAVNLLIDEGELNYKEIEKTKVSIKDDFDLTKLNKAINLFNEEHTIPEKRLEKYDVRHHYLLKRGYKRSTLNRFDIGFCSDSNDELYNRITIPWRDEKGRLVAINGRTVTGQKPKYKFSKDSYKNTFFNIHNQEKNDEPIILTEGELDTLRLYELGYPNSIALGGSNLEKRKWILRKYTTEVILALDMDSAGLEARKKIIEELYPIVNVSAVKLPDEKDVGDIKNQVLIDRIIEGRKMYKE